MAKTWPFLLGVAVLGAAAGVAIAGRPTPADTFVLDSSATTSTAPAATTTSVASETTSPSTTESAPSTTEVATSVPESSAPASTTTDVTTTDVTSTSIVDATLPRDQVRIVLANGDGRFNLAGSNAARLFEAGYVTIDQTDIGARYELTTLYYREGFEDEAVIVAADLLVPDAVLEPLGDEPITADDDLGDIIVVLGADAVR